MPTARPPKGAKRKTRSAAAKPRPKKVRREGHRPELVVITGMSGSGKASVLKVFEDLGYYSVDNMPVELIPRFAELVRSSKIERTALVVDVREGTRFDRLPVFLHSIKRQLRTTVIFLEASDEALLRRFSETRRPHPLGTSAPVKSSIMAERRRLRPIATLADISIDTSKFNVHELRRYIEQRFHRDKSKGKDILVSCVSFGFRQGVPEEADLVFDVRFLPNPHFIPKFRPLTGRDPQVAKYIRSFPQTQEFITRISDLLLYLLPHYIKEGKSYLTIAFGCTGGQHRSVMITEDVAKLLKKGGWPVKLLHRDSPR
jgi:UPF0042 nucleotide-binding protein